MAWGVPVIATRKAVEGLGVESGRHLLITDEPSQFADFANQLLKDKNRAEQLVQNAYEFVQENYSNNRLTKNLIAFYNQLLNE
jgi:glycosyltransferase involved in cell wall biosynthesis